VFFRHFHTLAGFGVAADTGRAMVQIEAAEATDFNTLTASKRAGHGINQNFYAVFDVFCQQLVTVFLGKNFCQTNH